jgi:2-dehydro-3-deoxygluconokinase
MVSYDLNYRDSLWKTRGGKDAANKLNRKLLPHADIAFGAFDFDSKLSNYDEREFRRTSEKMFAEFPNLKAVVSTLRAVHSASRHDLSAVCFCDNQIYKARDYNDIEVFDRIGSGDAFAAGFIYGCLAGRDLGYSIECGAALGALSMTTPGDNSTATLREVENLIGGGSAVVRR